MAEPKRRQRPKGYEIRESLKPKKPVRPTVKAMEDALTAGAAGSLLGAEAAADVAGSTDPYLSRNEFKEGFYEQPSKPPTTAETMYGKGTKRGFESPIVDPDTSMMQNMAEGGSVRGQKAIQVKKKIFKGIF
jgi:hypothetical protein